MSDDTTIAQSDLSAGGFSNGYQPIRDGLVAARPASRDGCIRDQASAAQFFFESAASVSSDPTNFTYVVTPASAACLDKHEKTSHCQLADADPSTTTGPEQLTWKRLQSEGNPPLLIDKEKVAALSPDQRYRILYSCISQMMDTNSNTLKYYESAINALECTRQEASFILLSLHTTAHLMSIATRPNSFADVKLITGYYRGDDEISVYCAHANRN